MAGSECDGSSHRALAEDILEQSLEGQTSAGALDIEALCQAHPECARELREAYEEWRVVGEVADALEGGAFGTSILSGLGLSASESELVRSFRPSSPEARYEVLEEVGRGGMGIILKVVDSDLKRTLAMKVARRRGPERGREEGHLLRFLEEAQIAGQLDHPGVLPVHELGIDGEERLYYTMPLVRGEDLHRVFEEVLAGDGDWTRTRALNVLLFVCEAMAYAHSKGVIHRDLKPANVMVGRYGEVYVVDWGLARVLGRPASMAGEAAAGDDALDEGVVSTARSSAEAADESSERTQVGAVLGTPAYMPPEQARGARDELDGRADVYAVGAMLYQLLRGHAPYSDRGSESSQALLLAILEGPPTPVEQGRRDCPPELAAICTKAMAREPADRYPDMGAMASDLRAFLESRVVAAYATGAFAEFRKWVARNRALASTILAAVVVVAGGSSGAALVLADKNRALEDANLEAEGARELAQDREREAVEEKAKVLRLSDVRLLEELAHEADGLWPASPDRISEFEAWLSRARDLGSRSDLHRETLAAMESDPKATEVEVAWQIDVLRELIAGLGGLEDPEGGAIASVEARVETALWLASEMESSAVAAAWERAAASVADPDECPQYGGLLLEPQFGLVPIGRDGRSGLWEFALLGSGSLPFRDASGELVLADDFALVFVLIPGGEATIGEQYSDPTGLHYDPGADGDNGPVMRVDLDPFLISKFEMTQAQWIRHAGENPSQYGPEFGTVDGKSLTLRHPVEYVSWTRCMKVVEELGLELPTNAQWEYAARAGSTSPWWTGAIKESLRGAANLADEAMVRSSHQNQRSEESEDWPELDDGYGVHAPVGTYLPNPFGLHEVHGNVREWCRDPHGYYYSSRLVPGQGVLVTKSPNGVASRGGSWQDKARTASSAFRFLQTTRDHKNNTEGLRPTRSLNRTEVGSSSMESGE